MTMKKYEPGTMVKSSRYRDFFPSLPVEVQNGILTRMDELLREEKAWCDRGNYEHMCQILTSVPMYEVLQDHGRTEEEAFRTVSEEMWKFLDPSGMQKLARKRFSLPLMKKKSSPSASNTDPEPDGAIPGIKTMRRTVSVLNATSASMRRPWGSGA